MVLHEQSKEPEVFDGKLEGSHTIILKDLKIKYMKYLMQIFFGWELSG